MQQSVKMSEKQQRLIGPISGAFQDSTALENDIYSHLPLFSPVTTKTVTL